MNASSRTLTTAKGRSVVTTLTDNEALEALKSNTSTFAQDLLVKRSRYGLSHDQLTWVHILAMEAMTVAPRVQLVDAVGMDEILEMFARAIAQGLAFPKVRLQTASGKKVVLAVAGGRSKIPGTVNVTDGGKYGENVWYGRINLDGTWAPGRAATTEVLDVLKEFAAAPQETAKKYGQLTGSCCFCGKDLTTKVSVHHGYGPICAEKYGLPWVGPKTDKKVKVKRTAEIDELVAEVGVDAAMEVEFESEDYAEFDGVCSYVPF